VAKDDLYGSSTPSHSYYAGSSVGTEPNMRQELANTFDGTYPEIAKSQPGLLRRMRLDDDGAKVPCPCVDVITKEPDKDRFCPICYGEGFLWDEEDLDIYRVVEDSGTNNALLEPGLINISVVVFYIRYDSDITRHDKIVQLVLDTEGDPVEPYQRRDVYRVGKAWDFRCDAGKLEYWKVFTQREDVRYLNAPSYGEI